VVAQRAHGHRTVGVGPTGAKLRSATLSGGKLVITASQPARRLSVRLTRLKASASLRAKVKADKLKRLKLDVVVDNVKGQRSTASVAVTLKG
jgi:hypothetical protein